MIAQRAFTLIELLVVVGIAAAVAAMVVAGMQRDRQGGAVRAAARELAAVLEETRARAIRTGGMHGIAFNLANGADTSGAVLNNWDGGHWYRMIGPAPFLSGTIRDGDLPPHCLNLRPETFVHAPFYRDAVRRCWRGPRHVLPPRQVRILAFGDTDEGSRKRTELISSAGQIWYTATYPRPWFGWFDPSTRIWRAWGGYDRTIPASGFFYEGDDGAITGCRHPSDRRFSVDLDLDGSFADHDDDGDGSTDGPFERERDYALWHAGDARPVLDADWLDACILFQPDGRALCLPAFHARRAFGNGQPAPGMPVVTAPAGNITSRWQAGMGDRAKMGWPKTAAAAPTGWWEYGALSRYDVPEIVHFDRHTGGWFITLAPDATDDDAHFEDAAAVLRHLMPCVRVFVSRMGEIRLIEVRRTSDALAGATPWPAASARWNDGGVQQRSAFAWNDCRFGWLHQPNNGDGRFTPEQMQPRGQAITDRLDERMLRDRIWWTTP
jgi:prepilin-type N-terminal cleavage/methylation domain-containing protein